MSIAMFFQTTLLFTASVCYTQYTNSVAVDFKMQLKCQANLHLESYVFSLYVKFHIETDSPADYDNTKL